ncbi:actin-like ATPase domain-containing protein [Testicularia cyperi]|uniref:Actin-like ATPase domain-containing protein n=1 Tax=Testicularia cyperi TaxID=1882483 RepID=A0A317XNQ1_9BASI|nr:actin-like ATPase domain-containing protein [Testicularia cyperi]
MVSAAAAAAAATASEDPLAGVTEIVVIDNGAHTIRIASVAYPNPSTNLPSAIRTSTHPNFIARTRSSSSSARRQYIGSSIRDELNDYAGLYLRQAAQRGIVVDWATQKLIWDHALCQHFQVRSAPRCLESKAVAITESYFGFPEAQAATDLLLFEEYGANAIWRTDSASLAAWSDIFDPTAASKGQTQAESRARLSRGGASNGTEGSSSSASSKKAARGPPLPLHRRPEAIMILDVGYSYCHAVPVIGGELQYHAIRRLDLGGKVLTNLLKEALSFRQLDMMDEFWLVDRIRERTCFVAASVGSRLSAHPPRTTIDRLRAGLLSSNRSADQWTLEELLILAKFGKRKSRIKTKQQKQPGSELMVEWKLPDYSSTSPGASEAEKERARYGHIVRGPNPGSKAQWLRRQAKQTSYDAAFVADLPGQNAHSSSADTAEHDPDDRQNGEEVEPAEDAGDEDESQSLLLENERFSVSETLFNPSAVGLEQNGLSQLVAESILALKSGASKADHAAETTTTRLELAASMIWSNILLIGGLSAMPGLKSRLINDLTPLKPVDVPLVIHQELDPAMSATRAGSILASAPPGSTEHAWLASKLLTRAQYEDPQHSVDVANRRFGRP